MRRRATLIAGAAALTAVASRPGQAMNARILHRDEVITQPTIINDPFTVYENCMFEGQGSGTAVRINAPNVTLRNCTIHGWSRGIDVRSWLLRVDTCVIKGNRIGVWFDARRHHYGRGENIAIAGGSVSGNRIGLYLNKAKLALSQVSVDYNDRVGALLRDRSKLTSVQCHWETEVGLPHVTKSKLAVWEDMFSQIHKIDHE